ncbi:MAG: hypothetical protein DCF12_01020 [Snowella sp.]|nr:MAG: hypothetical protein DCF12_01020 [Snowella sp.]
MITNNLTNATITIPLSEGDRALAQSFAQQQLTETKTNQVYLNTLAVLAMNHYLELLEIPTNLKQSQCWSVINQFCADIADLNLPKLGFLECRPISIHQDFCQIPLEVMSDRIAYCIVQISEDRKAGKLLGFVANPQSPRITVEQLDSLDNFLIFLANYQPKIKLYQWLENQIDEQWQTLETLLLPKKLAFRHSSVTSQSLPDLVNTLYLQDELSPPSQLTANQALEQLLNLTSNEELRWQVAEILWNLDPQNPLLNLRRILDLGAYFGGTSIGLMVGLLPKSDDQISLLFRLYCLSDRGYLPPGITLTGLDEQLNPFFEIKARENDDYIQFKCLAGFDEEFSIKISLGDTRIIKHFMT